MGLLDSLIPINQFDETYINSFTDFQSLELIEEKIKEKYHELKIKQKYIKFAELCVLIIARDYKIYVTNSEGCSIKNFYNSNFRKGLINTLDQLFEKNNSFFENMSINNGTDISFASYIYLLAKPYGIEIVEVPKAIKKQISALDSQIISILKKIEPFDDPITMSNEIINENSKIINNIVDQVADEMPVRKKFDFENEFEYNMHLALVALQKRKEEIIWEKTGAYLEKYASAHKAVEKRKTKLAKSLIFECIKLNPTSIKARFDLVEVYILDGDYKTALYDLDFLSRYLNTKEIVAKYYRRIGFIASKIGDYNLAYASYKYSLEFEYHPSANDEIKLMESYGVKQLEKVTDIQKILFDSNIKVIKTEMNVRALEDVSNRVNTIDDAVSLYQDIQSNIINPYETTELKETNERAKNENNFTIDNKSTIQVAEKNNSTYPKSKFCRICGTKLHEDSKFCENCGTKVI